ncbi:MAG TPA: hypothetical protein VM219_07295 [Phycisphaerae bacterium]|nr:hypothetical protein [Phycisphaerae bacterium]
MRALGAAILAIAILGLVFHAAFYFTASREQHVAYAHGAGMRVVVFLAFANLLAAILHYHRTRMRLVFWARIATYLWIISLVPFLRIILYPPL